MVLRAAVALAGLLAVAPAFAEPMNAETARRFVAGKLFAFNCFEGSTGSGRIFNDGSVAGVMRQRGDGATRFMHLPAGSLFPREGRICSNVKGAFFNPCFDLTKTSGNSFRGAVSGFGFAYCEFTKRGGRGETVQASIAPPSDTTGTATRVSIRRGHKAKHEQPAAAPTQPVTSAPLPSVEQAGIRTSIAP
jgi:hypothetical protein